MSQFQDSRSSKLCVVCGQDCANKPRTKDATGRYYCRSCHEQAFRHVHAERRRQEAGRAARDDVIALEPLDSTAHLRQHSATAPPPVCHEFTGKRACPSCGAAMNMDVEVCPSCQFSTQPGRPGVEALALAGDAVSAAPNPWLAPVHLVIRPFTFYRHFANACPVIILVLSFWVFGMAAAADRLDTRIVLGSMTGKSNPLGDSWGAYWLVVSLAGMFAGLLYAAIGGWWYRVRVRFSGGGQPDYDLVRRVYVFASLIWAVPALLACGVDSMLYTTPKAAIDNGSNPFTWLAVAAFVWSLWTSYAGARTAFKVDKAGGILWFIALPAILYAIGLAAVLAVSLLGTLVRPDVQHPDQFRSATLTFSYPGNWWIDELDADHDPESDIFIDSMLDATLHVIMYESARGVDAELSNSVQDMKFRMRGAVEGEALSEWGGYRGAGRVVRGVNEGVKLTARIFVAEIAPGQVLEILEVVADDDANETEPGFQLIRATLQARAAASPWPPATGR